jgi:hypothetical protein
MFVAAMEYIENGIGKTLFVEELFFLAEVEMADTAYPFEFNVNTSLLSRTLAAEYPFTVTVLVAYSIVL